MCVLFVVQQLALLHWFVCCCINYGELISLLQGQFVSLDGIFLAAGQRILELRGGLTQAEFAARLGVDRKTVVGWEAGKRLPDGTSLLKLMTEFGADVNYILMGRSGDGPRLSAEENVLLSYYRQSEPAVRRAALGALLGTAGQFSQHATGGGSVQIGRVEGGSVKVKKAKG